jgi:hypothetical protein
LKEGAITYRLLAISPSLRSREGEKGGEYMNQRIRDESRDPQMIELIIFIIADTH